MTNQGKNSATWVSAEPGRTPKWRKTSNLTRLLATMSALVQSREGSVRRQCEPAGGAIQTGWPSRRPGSSRTARNRAKPSSPPMRNEVTRGRWLTPATVGSISRMSASKTRLSQNWSPTSSLQSPIVRTVVCEETARHSAVSGLLTLSRVACGA